MNLKEPDTGVVHICDPRGTGDCTLCGFALDNPGSEEDRPNMEDTDEICNCDECVFAANQLIPVLRREMTRISKRKRKNTK